jgi:hypothetical protein
MTATVVEPDDEDRRPYAARWVASCAGLVGGLERGPVVLVGHSGAGPLLAALGYALRAAHRPVAAYAFLDAGLPRAAEASRLDAWAAEDPTGAAEVRAHLEAGGRFPTWSPDDLADTVPDPEDRRTVVASLRPRGHEYWTEPLPAPVDWPDAPCAYLRTSAAYDVALREARLRGWPTDSLELGHFPGFTDPQATARALLDLLRPVTCA